jgi:hypothetical protein
MNIGHVKKMKPTLKAKCDGCEKPIFEKRKATLVFTLTLCPVCIAEVKTHFVKTAFDINAIKTQIKAEMCDQCAYNPYHNPEQIFYR